MGVTWTGEGWAKDVTPDHYASTRADLQPWDVIEAFELDYWRGNALKYLLRAGRKGDLVEDLRKAQHYLQYIIDKETYREDNESVEALACAFECQCSSCTPEPPTNEAPEVEKKPGEGPMEQARRIAQEMAEPDWADPDSPSERRLNFYLQRFHGRR